MRHRRLRRLVAREARADEEVDGGPSREVPSRLGAARAEDRERVPARLLEPRAEVLSSSSRLKVTGGDDDGVRMTTDASTANEERADKLRRNSLERLARKRGL